VQQIGRSSILVEPMPRVPGVFGLRHRCVPLAGYLGQLSSTPP